jgi:HEAT repeat protein
MTETITINELVDALGSSDIHVRVQAKNMLAERGPAVIEPLIEALRHGNRYQSYEAANILALFNDPRCFEALAQALSSQNVMVAQYAARSLPAYGREIALQHFIASLPCAPLLAQIQIIESLKEMDDERAVEPLILLLQATEAAMVRYSVIEALGVLGATRAIDLIRSFENDANRHVRDRVRRALEQSEVSYGATAVC